MIRTRKAPAARREEILAAALVLAESVGYRTMTRAQVAESAGVCRSLVRHYFGSLEGLRGAVLQAAIDRGSLRVVGQAVALGDPLTSGLSAGLRAEALAALAG